MVGAYVAATIVTLVQYLRLKDRRLLLLLALFACQAQALARDWFDYRKEVFQTASCAAGLALLLALTLRHPTAPGGTGPHPPSASAEGDAEEAAAADPAPSRSQATGE